MRKQLVHDTAAGELRLVYTDLYNGQHERTEYRVTNSRVDGSVIRTRQDLDGVAVHGTAPDLWISAPLGQHIPVWTEQVAVGPTVATPCPRVANRRKRCDLCAADQN